MFLCRHFGKEFHVDFELMSHVFGFPDGGLRHPPKEFNMLSFWRRITEDGSFIERKRER